MRWLMPSTKMSIGEYRHVPLVDDHGRPTGSCPCGTLSTTSSICFRTTCLTSLLPGARHSATPGRGVKARGDFQGARRTVCGFDDLPSLSCRDTVRPGVRAHRSRTACHRVQTASHRVTPLCPRAGASYLFRPFELKVLNRTDVGIGFLLAADTMIFWPNLVLQVTPWGSANYRKSARGLSSHQTVVGEPYG